MTSARQWLTAAAVMAIAVLLGAMSMLDIAPGMRSVQPLSLTPLEQPAKFDPAQSAALFVGVREFDSRDVTPVRYAVDDAVDLAYAFSFGGRSRLVEPERVVLALSGEPQKEESQRRLERLRAAGATMIPATPEELRSSLQQQAARVAAGGLLLVSFATHGFLGDDGTHYLLGRDSTFEAGTSLSATQVLDVASRAARSLVLVDACRERVPSGSRAGDAGPRSSAPAIGGSAPASGQVVFYAAPPGGYAFDADGNGAFTKAILEGLACKGSGTRVNVEQLHRYVEERVREWVERERGAKSGVQVNMEGRMRLMLLANCNCESQPPPSETWRQRLRSAVTRWEVADLDGDCTSEVVAQAGGRVYAFDQDGKELWSAGEAVREFFIGTAYDGERDVLALSPNGFQLLDHGGKTISRVLGDLPYVRLYRPNGNHRNRIVAIAGDTVMLFKRNKSVPEWRLRLPAPFESLDMADRDKNRRLDLVLHTAEGPVVVDVHGQTLNGARVERLPRK